MAEKKYPCERCGKESEEKDNVQTNAGDFCCRCFAEYQELKQKQREELWAWVRSGKPPLPCPKTGG